MIYEVNMTGRTRDPLLVDILMARKINSYCGTSLGWWDIGQLEQSTLDLFEGLTTKRFIQSSINTIEKAKQDYRNSILSRKH